MLGPRKEMAKKEFKKRKTAVLREPGKGLIGMGCTRVPTRQWHCGWQGRTNLPGILRMNRKVTVTGDQEKGESKLT